MLFFPNAKINFGLNILSRREDGYHNLETLFYPIGLRDAMEFVENNSKRVNLTLSGIPIDADPEDNIVLKAYNLLKSEAPLPGLDIHLHKVIPFGAGLGGGSSDAAFFLKAVNDHFELRLSEDQLMTLASKLGADCAFFLKNRPALASGIGERLNLVDFHLHGYYLLLVKPSFGVNTREAYADIRPAVPEISISQALKESPEDWMSLIKNDFEPSVFKKYPEIARIKKDLLEQGAVYASMSGSGSSVFGIFTTEPDLSGMNFGDQSFIWKELL